MGGTGRWEVEIGKGTMVATVAWHEVETHFVEVVGEEESVHLCEVEYYILACEIKGLKIWKRRWGGERERERVATSKLSTQVSTIKFIKYLPTLKNDFWH